jgi:hypothetical protein
LALQAQADYALLPKQHGGRVNKLAREVAMWEGQRKRELLL